MTDPRIGKKAQDGAVEVWPAVTITGRAYVRPVSMTSLGGGYFCVTDNEPITSDERDALIAALKEMVSEPTRHRTAGRSPRRAVEPVDDAVSDTEE